jgi:hypothetical protein
MVAQIFDRARRGRGVALWWRRQRADESNRKRDGRLGKQLFGFGWIWHRRFGRRHNHELGGHRNIDDRLGGFFGDGWFGWKRRIDGEWRFSGNRRLRRDRWFRRADLRRGGRQWRGAGRWTRRRSNDGREHVSRDPTDAGDDVHGQ